MMTEERHITRLAAVRNRATPADDPFVYAVVTTGIFCRPNCPSRQAKDENIRFFDHPDDARKQGYRACKRCRPDEDGDNLASIITRACRWLADPEAPSLDDLAAEAGYSPAHFHKLFKQETGLTPKAFQQAARQERVQDALKQGQTVTRALFDAGFDSASQGYEAVRKQTGLTPANFRRKGRDMDIRYVIRPCPLGLILVAGSAKGICRIELGDDRAMLENNIKSRFTEARLAEADPDFTTWLDIVLRWIDLPDSKLDLPLDIRGTAFQQKVWAALRDIPPGSQVSYGDLARIIGQPTASRAVASACARNEIALAIPCHRVVRGDGQAGGYRWGPARKKTLLDREQAVTQ